MSNQPHATTAPILLATWSFGVTACRAGWPMLNANSNASTINNAALNAVEAACRAVEEDPTVDSVGYGGLPDRAGRVTLDGAIMLSPEQCGSVCAVRHCKYPVSLARKVMQHTPHIMLAGAYADEFAIEHGLHTEENLLTKESHATWQKWLEQSDVFNDDRYRGWVPPANVEELRGVDSQSVLRSGDDGEQEAHNAHHDTVGVIAIDQAGTLASACSTSGMAFKVPGRVGDSPIVGHGLYTEPGVACAIATGAGELLMGVCASFLAVERIRNGDSPADATRHVVERIVKSYRIHPRHQAVVLAMNAQGEWAAAALRSGYRTAIKSVAHDEPMLIDAQWVAIPEESKRPDQSML